MVIISIRIFGGIIEQFLDIEMDEHLQRESLENVLKQDFSTDSINKKWVRDRTYIHTLKDGWYYLASVLDLHSKKIIGYTFGQRMTNDLVVKALRNAYYLQSPSDNLIFHSDLESHYISNDMKALCKNLNITQSFSKKGCPYDNSCIGSFHAIIKKKKFTQLHIKHIKKLR